MLNKDKLSLWHVLIFICVHATQTLPGSGAYCDIRVVLDFRVSREERLGVVVVENAGLAIVFALDHDEITHFLGRNDVFLREAPCFSVDTRRVSKRLFSSLCCILGCLDRKIVFSLISRMVAPVSSRSFSLLDAFSLSASNKVLSPSATSAEEVPVSVTVDGHSEKTAPKDPAAFSNHPYVRFAHVVRYVEHHYFYYNLSS